MTMTAEERQSPALITEVSGTEFRQRAGRLLAEVAAGAVVRIVDRRMGIIRAYLIAELPAGLDPVSDLIPPPGAEDGSPVLKRCPSCLEKKPANSLEFHCDSSSPDGLSSLCRPCKNAVNAASWHRQQAGASGQDERPGQAERDEQMTDEDVIATGSPLTGQSGTGVLPATEQGWPATSGGPVAITSLASRETAT